MERVKWKWSRRVVTECWVREKGREEKKNTVMELERRRVGGM